MNEPSSARRSRSDAEVLELIAEGDLTALGEIYDRHYESVRRVLARVGTPPHDIDDIVQLTFLELPKVARSFDGRESARAWLAGIAVRLASRRARSFGRLARTLASFARTTMHVATATPEDIAGGRAELRVFAEALANLSVDKRTAFVLVEIEGATAEEVSRALGVPAATVRTRVFYARAALREAMKGIRP